LICLIGLTSFFIIADLSRKRKANVVLTDLYLYRYDDYYTVTGVARNGGDGTAYDVIIFVRDEYGAMVTITLVGNLAPNERRSFSGTFAFTGDLTAGDIKVTWD